MTLRRCPRCPPDAQWHPPEEFYVNRGAANGLSSYCKECVKAAERLRYRRRAGGGLVRDPDPTPPVEPAPPPTPPLPPLEQARADREQRQQRATERQQLKAALHEADRLRAELDAIHGLQESARHLAPDVFVPKAEHRGDGMPLLVASDWHVEEPVVPESVGGLNEYSPEIARERGRAWAQNALKLNAIQARELRIERVAVALLGDFFTGFLHDENREVNEMGPVHGAQLALEMLAAAIDLWLKETPWAYEFPCIAGNHGRITDVMRSEPSGTSLEYFMYGSLAARYAQEPRVSFQVPRAAMLYRQYYPGFTVRFIHGYEVNYGGGVGGITIPLRKAVDSWSAERRASLTVLGHFHQLIDGGDMLVNGSLIGYSAYSRRVKARFAEPVQSWTLLLARNGGVRAGHMPVFLTGKEQPAPVQPGGLVGDDPNHAESA